MSSDQEKITELFESARESAHLARKVLLKHFGNLSRVSDKEKAGLVTEADVESEKVITDLLFSRHPEVPILGEEGSYQNKGKESQNFETQWYIDPLDGTTNYVHGFSIFCISIGLKFKNELAAAVIDVPLLDKTYTAIKGQGAFVNGEPLKVSQRSTLQESLLATGFFSHDKEILKDQIDKFTHIMGETRGIRRAGAAAYDLCMVAEGIFDGFWETNLSPWDTAAGALLVTEAGGTVTNLEGKSFQPEDKTVLASNSLLHENIRGRLVE